MSPLDRTPAGVGGPPRGRGGRGRRGPAGAPLPVLLVVATVLSPSAVTGQATVAGGAGFEIWDFAEPAEVGAQRLSLLTLPFGGGVSLGRRVELSVGGAWARGLLERPDGTEADISGPTDTRLTLSFSLADDAVVLTGIGLLPTGHTEHTPEEAEVAALVASDLFPFRISNWGNGGGVGGSAAVARPFGDFGVAVSAGYIVGREFEPLEGGGLAYRPANQLQLRAAFDRNVGGDGKLALQLLFQDYARDRFDGVGVYQPGSRVQGILSWAFPAGSSGSALLYAGALHRGEGSFDERIEVAPTRDLLMAGGGVRVPFAGGVAQPSADLRVFRQADGVGQGFTVGIGASVDWDLDGVTLSPSARFRVGRVDVRESSSSGVTGLDVGATLRLGGAP